MRPENMRLVMFKSGENRLLFKPTPIFLREIRVEI